MTAQTKLDALKARTLENGCTPGEVAAAQAAIARLHAKHPHLDQPQPQAWDFRTVDQAIREGMRRAARAAQRARNATPCTKQEVFSAAERGAKNKTAALRAAARGWRAAGWSRATFVNEAVARGYASATASTQWQRSTSQD